MNIPENISRRADHVVARLQKAVTPSEREEATREAAAVLAEIERWKNDTTSHEVLKAAFASPRKMGAG